MNINKLEREYWSKETGVLPYKHAPEIEELVDTSSEPFFHIGQPYEKKVAGKLVCKLCGGDHFYVGRGDYYTAIKCVKCEWEKCIHEG
jgi:hypothetical protein